MNIVKVRLVSVMVLALFVGLLAVSCAKNSDSSPGNVPVVKKETKMGDIAKDSAGNVLHLKISDAIAYCKDHGARVPTVRELALFVSQTYGSEGIKETDFPNQVPNGDPSNPVDVELSNRGALGQQVIWKFNDQKQRVVDFYYSKTGFQRPEVLENLWTSSRYPDDDSVQNDYYWFGGLNEEFYDLSYNFANAVRCIQDI